MSTIECVCAREVLDSRGKPTVEAEVHLAGGIVGSAISPSGASTGAAEACELRDGDAKRYDGQGVLRAVNNVNEILGPQLRGIAAGKQAQIDGVLIELDGTANKSRLGANGMLAVSMAVAQAAAAAKSVPLYLHLNELFNAGPRNHVEPRMALPMTNMISGGKHAGGNLDIQDVLIMPHAAPDYPTGLEWIVRVYRRLGRVLHDRGLEGYLVGDEGGFGPRGVGNDDAIELVVRAIEAAGLQPGADVTVAVDVASSHFFRDRNYYLREEFGRPFSSAEMTNRLKMWVDRFPITSIEDGLAEEDWPGWQELTAQLGSRCHIVGDDLFATNEARIQKGIELHAGNAVLIKMNQIGTLSETLDAVALAKSAGFATIVSARSGETEDTFMSDLAVAVAADRIKIGSIARSERLAKYNRLLRIEEQLRS